MGGMPAKVVGSVMNPWWFCFAFLQCDLVSSSSGAAVSAAREPSQCLGFDSFLFVFSFVFVKILHNLTNFLYQIIFLFLGFCILYILMERYISLNDNNSP